VSIPTKLRCDGTYIKKWRKVVITAHGFKRLKHRCHISKKAARNYVKRAFNLGFSYKTLPDNINRYINSLYTRYNTANNIRIYGSRVFIFANNVFITAYDLPQQYVAELKEFMEMETSSVSGIDNK